MKRKTNIQKTIDLYQNVGWKKYFSKWRFKVAPYIEVEKYIPKEGKIIELGCGEGIFTNYMGISSVKRKITGFEISSERIKEASRKLPNVSFKKADVTKANLPSSDAIVLFHLLHHLMSQKDQEKLLEKCVKALKKNGSLVIVEVNMKPSLKFLIAWFFDHFIVPTAFEKRFFSRIFFRKQNKWVKILKNNGLKVKKYEFEKNMPFPHIVFIGTK